MSPARLWPAAIVAVLAITVAANVALYVAATGRDAPAPEPDYYRKAVAWDSTLALARASAALGWRVDARLAPAGADSMRLTLTVADRDQQAIEGAARITLRHDRPPAVAIEGGAALDPAGRGAFSVAGRRVGRWEIDLDLRRGSERFVARLYRQLEAGS